MIQFGKIVCPTDFSEASLEGIKAANSIAERFSSELILAYVILPILPITAPAGESQSYDVLGYNREMRVSAQRSIEEMAGRIISDNIKKKTAVLEGTAAEEIVTLAGDENADMIIMSTHGMTGWRRFVFGSVTERVVRLADCPVLTIPAPRTEQ